MYYRIDRLSDLEQTLRHQYVLLYLHIEYTLVSYYFKNIVLCRMYTVSYTIQSTQHYMSSFKITSLLLLK